MSNLPIFLNGAARAALVIGTSEAAVTKARLLARLGVPHRHLAQPPARIDADRFMLPAPGEAQQQIPAKVAFVATGDAADDETIADGLRRAGLLVNVIDRPALSDFFVPAIVDRAPVRIAVSTDGAAPALARRLRFTIERLLPENIGSVAGFLGGLREKLSERVPDFASRRRVWDRLIDLALDSPAPEAEEDTLISRAIGDGAAPGEVKIVGAGPGDPGLLTLKAIRALEHADIVFYDRLVADEILGYVRRDARLVAVGKSAGAESAVQSDINALLIDHARRGEQVVRLKGGDPFIFGRGGEEVAALRDAGVRVTIVPGITAAIGIAAALELPLTHRDLASQLVFVTGRLKGGEAQRFAKELGQGRTLAVYMGRKTAGRLTADLLAYGAPRETPVALVEKGTQPGERRVFCRLHELPDTVRANGIGSPALILIGDVVALAKGFAAETAATTQQPAPAEYTQWVAG